MKIFIILVCLLALCYSLQAKEIMLSTATESRSVQSTSMVESVRVSKDTVQVDIVTTTLVDGMEPVIKQVTVTLVGTDYDGFVKNCDIDMKKIEDYLKAYTGN